MTLPDILSTTEPLITLIGGGGGGVSTIFTVSNVVEESEQPPMTNSEPNIRLISV
jgi:hypothetical protein